MSSAEVAQRALKLLDLTSLNDDDNEQVIVDLCSRASTKFGQVAAVCVYPDFVKIAARELAGSSVKIASVANFPLGYPDPEPAKKQTMQIIRDGGEEVDVVFPWRNFLDGDLDSGSEMVSGCKARCGDGVKLKVILETGGIADEQKIYQASRIALDAGADFLKTSTGKIPECATPNAARQMLQAIVDSGSECGLKISGGVKSVADAAVYLALADEMMGVDWVTADTFRFGASSLMDQLLDALAD